MEIIIYVIFSVIFAYPASYAFKYWHEWFDNKKTPNWLSFLSLFPAGPLMILFLGPIFLGAFWFHD